MGNSWAVVATSVDKGRSESRQDGGISILSCKHIQPSRAAGSGWEKSDPRCPDLEAVHLCRHVFCSVAI